MPNDSLLVPAGTRNALLSLINDYQSHVERFVVAAQHEFGEQNLLAGVLGGWIPEEGQMPASGVASFRFHGAGCYVTFPDANVDFDFGPGGRHDGFDAWRLHEMAESCPDRYPELQSVEDIERALEELMHTDLIFSPRWLPSPHLLYFKEPA